MIGVTYGDAQSIPKSSPTNKDQRPTTLLTAVVLAGTTAEAHTPPPTAVVAAAAAATSLLSESTNKKLPPLAEILHDTEHFHQIESDGGKMRVKCQVHVVQSCHAPPRHKEICTCVLPQAHRDNYQDLPEKKLGKQTKKPEGYYTFEIN